MNVRLWWSNIDPKLQKIIALSAIIGLGILVISFATVEKEPEKLKPRHETIKSVLTDKSTREIGIDALASNVTGLNDTLRTMKRDMEFLRKEIETKGASNSSITRDISDLKEQISQIAGNLHERENSDKDLNKQKAAGNTEVQLDRKNTQNLFNGDITEGSVLTNTAQSAGSEAQPITRNIVTIKSVSEAKKQELDSVNEHDDSQSLFLPAGSIITGTLINGMDAPTGQAARRDPFPSTLRVQKEAILPNRFRADIKECFLILSGYGDLSSERAYLRGENFSCVRDDGGIIEVKLDSYAMGEDGKAGIRGRLVSKQGQVIAKSLMAGFLSGAAEAFDVNPVASLNTGSAGSNVQYQSVYSPQLLQGAGVKGASNALERVAQFYIQMAEGIFPVIEVDAGRQIDVIVTKGTKLSIKNQKG